MNTIRRERDLRSVAPYALGITYYASLCIENRTSETPKPQRGDMRAALFLD